jgi:putative hemolysin
MSHVAFEMAVLLMLLVANGYFALSEISIVSSRRTRLAQSARAGDHRAGAALRLAESPARFLSAVQIGITLIGTLSGAYGGATLAEELAVALARYPVLAPYAEEAAVALVVLAISFASVVIGELVPKRMGLSDPERFARLVSGPMTALSRVAAPVVTALERTADALIRLFHLPHGSDSAVTEADVSAMVAAGTEAGVFDPAERRMVERVFRLDDEPVAAMMTPRPDIVWLDVHDPIEANLDLVRRHPYSRFPVCDGGLDHVIGIVTVRDIWMASTAGIVDLRAVARQPLVVPDTAVALDVLAQLQQHEVHMALVVDEHGGLDGLLTLNNLLQFLAAPTGGDAATADVTGIVQRTPTSWLVDGGVSLGDFCLALGLPEHVADQPRPYHTVAGLVMAEFGRVPTAGDVFTRGSLRIEVVDMDGFRVDKVLVTRLPGVSGSA